MPEGHEMEATDSKLRLVTSPLAAVLRELLAMRSVAHGSDALPFKQRHLSQPLRCIKTQPLQDGRKVSWNIKSRTLTFLTKA
jgi:hypothetical protein